MRRPVPHGPGGIRNWYNERGNYHRDGGPAIERPEGDKSWYWHGVLMYDEMSDTVFPEDDPLTICYMPTDDDVRNAGGPRFVMDLAKDNFWSPGYSKPRKRS